MAGRPKGILLFLSLFIFPLSRAQVLLTFANDSLYGFTYSGGDEFNTSKVDENTWQLRIWPGTNASQFFAYEPANTKINDGVVTFSMLRKDSVYLLNPYQVDSVFFKKAKFNLADPDFNMNYSAGSIVSKEKYHFGLYELRFKIEEGKGVWPAFWFYGGDRNEEIDVFELKGERTDEIHVDTHCPTGCDPGYRNKLGIKRNWGGWLPVSKHLSEGFNIISLDWRKDGLTWFINGFPLASFEGAFPNAMNLYINTQVASDYSAFQPAPDESTKFPNNFYVDYLRVWTPAQHLVLPQTSGFRYSDQFPSTYDNQPKRRRGGMYNKKELSQQKGTISLVHLERGKIQVTVTGEINNSINSLSLKGSFGSYQVATGGGGTIASVDPREKNIEVVLIINGKVHSRKIELLD